MKTPAHKNLLEMQQAMAEIPHGTYCYESDGKGGIHTCRFWTRNKDYPPQENGYCAYLELGDWDMEGGLLWDQCKECGINEFSELERCTDDREKEADGAGSIDGEDNAHGGGGA